MNIFATYSGLSRVPDECVVACYVWAIYTLLVAAAIVPLSPQQIVTVYGAYIRAVYPYNKPTGFLVHIPPEIIRSVADIKLPNLPKTSIVDYLLFLDLRLMVPNPKHPECCFNTFCCLLATYF